MDTLLDLHPRVRLYLDVDGVINAQMPYGWGRLQNGHVGLPFQYRIRWAPRMIESLRDLDVELCWATTWRDQASHSLSKLIGFGEDVRWLNPQRENQMIDYSIYWKEQAVQIDQTESPSPFIWIDDELTPDHVALWPDALVIQTDPRLGITPTHVAQMQQYIKSVS